MAKCKVAAGMSVEDWPGELTPTQCEAFPVIGPAIGQGSFASAYQHAEDPTKVVKFTADPADAGASLLVAKKPLKGTVRVFKVAKLKGQYGTAPVMDPDGDFEDLTGQPIYGIITEKVDKLTFAQHGAITSLWNQFRRDKDIFRSFPPKEFEVSDFVDSEAMVDFCLQAKGTTESECRRVTRDALAAINEQAHEIDVIPLDVPPRNWGNRDGKPVILDLGVSAARDLPQIEDLAGVGKKGQKHMARRHRSYRRHLGQAEDMPAVYSAPRGINWKSPWVWGSALAAIGAIFFLSRKGKAAPAAADKSKPKDTSTPTGSETGGGGSTEVNRDPGSGVAVAGPSGNITPMPSYTISKGESWSNIASRTYGDYRWWPALWDANRSGGTQYQDPSVLRPGDAIRIPDLPIGDQQFKAEVFARAEADRQWELDKKKAKKQGKAFNTPRPGTTFAATPVPSQPAPAGSSVTAKPTEPTIAPALDPLKELTTEEELAQQSAEAEAKLANR